MQRASNRIDMYACHVCGQIRRARAQMGWLKVMRTLVLLSELALKTCPPSRSYQNFPFKVWAILIDLTHWSESPLPCMMIPVHNLGFSWLTCIHCPTASTAPDQLLGTVWLQSSQQWIKQVSGYCLKLEYVTCAPEVTACTSRCSFSAAVIPWNLPIKASRVRGCILRNELLFIY